MESDKRLQELVRNVVSAVLSSPADNQQQTNSQTTPTQFSSVEDEISQRFNLGSRTPRGPRGADHAASSRFNPRLNYSFSKKKKNKRQGEGPVPDIVYKDVCLLPTPEWNQVPKGQSKASLIARGLYIDALQIDKNWDENTLYTTQKGSYIASI